MFDTRDQHDRPDHTGLQWYFQAYEWAKVWGPRLVLVAALAVQVVGAVVGNMPPEVTLALLTIAVLLLFEVIRDIHAEIKRRVETRTYLSFENIIHDELKAPILRAAQDTTLRIQVIGITLENQWKQALKRRFIDLKNNSSVSVSFEAVVIHPEAEGIPGFDENHRADIGRMISDVALFFGAVDDRKSDARWECRVYGVKTIPGIAGILVDDVTLFRTLTDVEYLKPEEQRLSQGRDMYEIFEFPGREGESFDNETISHFKRVFKLYTSRENMLYDSTASAERAREETAS